MANSRDQMLDQYDEYFRKHLPDLSQQCINNLVNFLYRVDVFKYDEEQAGKICDAFIHINRLNREILKILAPLETSDNTLFDTNIVNKPLVEKATHRVLEGDRENKYAGVIPMLNQCLAKIQDAKNPVDQEQVAKFVDATLKMDKAYQKLSFYERMVKDFEDHPSRNPKYRKLQIKRRQQQLMDLSHATIKFFKNMINKLLLEEHGVKNLSELEGKLRQEKKMLEEKGTDLDGIQIKRMDEHIEFIRSVEERIIVTQKLLTLPLEDMSIDLLMNNLLEFMKHPQSQCNKEKSYEKQLEEKIKNMEPIMNKFNASKDKQLSLAQVVGKYKIEQDERVKENKQDANYTANVTTMNSFLEAAAFLKFFSGYMITLSNDISNEVQKISGEVTKVDSTLSFPEIKEIAKKGQTELARDKVIEKKDAQAVVLLLDEMEVSSKLDRFALSILELRNDVLDEYKKILGLPEHLTVYEALDRMNVGPNIFSTYLVKDFDIISKQVRELKVPEGKDKDTINKSREEALIRIKKLELIKQKIDFLKERIAILLPVYFGLPHLMTQRITKDFKTMSNIAFLGGPSPKIRERKAYELDRDAIKARNKSFQEKTDEQVVKLNNLFVFNKLKNLIIKGYQEAPVKDLIKSLKEGKLPSPLFDAVPAKVKNRFIEYLEESDNLESWEHYKQQSPLDEKKLDSKIFAKEWENAVKELKKVKSTPTADDTFELINNSKEQLFKELEMLQSIVRDSNLRQLDQELHVLWDKELRGLVPLTPEASSVTVMVQSASPDRRSLTPTVTAVLSTPMITPLVTPDYRSELGLSGVVITPVVTPQMIDSSVVDKKDSLTVPVTGQKPKLNDDEVIRAGASAPQPVRKKPQLGDESIGAGAANAPAVSETKTTPKPEEQVTVTPTGVRFHRRKPSQYPPNLFPPKEKTPTPTPQQLTPSANSPENPNADTTSGSQPITKKQSG